MRTLLLVLLGIACFWGYKNDVHKNLELLYENKEVRNERNRQLNIIESKIQMTFFELFSG